MLDNLTKRRRNQISLVGRVLREPQHGWFILIAVTKNYFSKKFASRSQTFNVSNAERSKKDRLTASRRQLRQPFCLV